MTRKGFPVIMRARRGAEEIRPDGAFARGLGQSRRALRKNARRKGKKMRATEIVKVPDAFQSMNEERENRDFRIFLNGEQATVSAIRVSRLPYNRIYEGNQRPLSQSEVIGLVSFEGEGEVRVEVKTEKPFSSAVVRPLSKGVAVTREGGRVSFTLPAHGQYSLEFDDVHTSVELFYDPPKIFAAKESYTHYYGSGVHYTGIVSLKSGDRVYIDRDAQVYGGFYAEGAEDIRIEGYGRINGKVVARVAYPFLHNRGDLMFVNCKNVSVEGVTLLDAAFWVSSFFNCDGIRMENVKITGQWRYNTDGIDLVSCKNAEIRNCFVRAFDDVIVLKGYSQFEGYTIHTVENILVEDCVLWCDWGRTVEVGCETVAREYRNIRFEGCDLIHNAAVAIDIQNGDCAFVHDFTVKNSTVEFQRTALPEVLQWTDEQVYDAEGKIGMPYFLWIANRKYHTGDALYDGKRAAYSEGVPFGRVEDVTVENIRIFGEEGLPSYKLMIGSADPDIPFKNIRVANISIDGTAVTDTARFDAEVDERTENLELFV